MELRDFLVIKSRTYVCGPTVLNLLTEVIKQVTYTLEAGAKWKIAMHATVDQQSPILLRYVY